MADLIVGAVRRRHEGAGVAYAFVGLDGKGASASETTTQATTPSEPADPPTAAQCIRGLTQKQLAARAGITQTVLSRTESGAGNPTLGLLEEIAAALDLRLDVSFYEIDKERA